MIGVVFDMESFLKNHCAAGVAGNCGAQQAGLNIRR